LLVDKGKKIFILNSKTFKVLRRIDLKDTSNVKKAILSPDGGRILAQNRYGKLWIWNTFSGKQLGKQDYSL